MEIKIEDIIFWGVVLLIIATSIWLLIGSPTDTAAIIAIGIFVASSEILLWKSLFKSNEKNAIKFERFDKKTSMSFEKMKNNLNTKFLEVNNNLNQIKKLIKK